MLGVWLGVLMLTGFVGMSTMVATLAFTVWVLIGSGSSAHPLFYFGLIMMVFVIYTHRSNIQRMLNGTENRAKKMWIFKPKD